MINPKVLLVEDTLSMQLLYKTILERGGFHVDTAETARSGLEMFSRNFYPLVVLDLGLPDQSGGDVMREILRIQETTKIVVITTNGTLTTAVEAMRDGAFDFLVKPMSDKRLVTAVENAAKHYSIEAEQLAGQARHTKKPPPDLTALRGSSLAITEVRRRILAIAKTSAIVFLSGEVGTGKVTAARYVHYESNRAQADFVHFDVTAVPKGAQKAQLFGEEGKPGIIAAAHQGTLLIDDVCMLEDTAQAALLRFLQTQRAVMYPDETPTKVDVRIICATRFDPIAAVEAGKLREDLFYRLHVVPIHLPPFRQRQRDVIEIAQKILTEYAEKDDRPVPELTAGAIDQLLGHDLPGNLQQVQSVLRKAYHTTKKRTIGPAEIGLDTPHAQTAFVSDAATTYPSSEDIEIHFERLVGLSLDRAEYHLIQATLKKFDGAVVKAAEVLGVAPSTLYRKLDAWNKATAKERFE